LRPCARQGQAEGSGEESPQAIGGEGAGQAMDALQELDLIGSTGAARREASPPPPPKKQRSSGSEAAAGEAAQPTTSPAGGDTMSEAGSGAGSGLAGSGASEAAAAKRCCGCGRPASSPCLHSPPARLDWGLPEGRGRWCMDCFTVWRLMYAESTCTLEALPGHLGKSSENLAAWELTLLSWWTLKREGLGRISRQAVIQRRAAAEFILDALCLPAAACEVQLLATLGPTAAENPRLLTTVVRRRPDGTEERAAGYLAPQRLRLAAAETRKGQSLMQRPDSEGALRQPLGSRGWMLLDENEAQLVTARFGAQEVDEAVALLGPQHHKEREACRRQQAGARDTGHGGEH
jgi:hypothetical protein